MAANNSSAPRSLRTVTVHLITLWAIVVTQSRAAEAETPAETPPAAVSQPPAEVAPAAEAQPATVAPPAADETAKMVRLDFQGQQWLEVLDWLARTQKLNLDWQQLPPGELNLSSTKEYSIEEAEDLINMQLLARGFTLLKRGEVLRVTPLKNLDITLVPQVNAEELVNLPRHQFVRVTFPLDWMIAEEAAQEFKPLISPYGQIFPMASSNRLEAMDAVVNLRELYRLLTRSEADEGRRERVAEFRLKHRRAEEVAAKVRQLLGLPADAPPTAATLTQRDIEQAKFRAEAVKALGRNAQPLLKDKPDVHLVVNDKENSILVNGRPDKIEIARQAIEAMDKPLPPGESSWESINRVKVYEVSGFDPATVTQLLLALQERGNISKETRIQHEATNNRLVVFASPEDQVTIANVIASFRTQGRRAEVLPLARIDPQYAAKAVQLVLKNPARPASAPGPASEGQFQVEPDLVHNRLLLWATPAEVAEVRDFLGRLGESFLAAQANAQMHIVQLRGAKAQDVTQRLQHVWKEISDAPLVIEAVGTAPAASATPVTTVPPDTPPVTPPATSPAESAAPAAETEQKSEPMTDRSAAARPAALLVSQQTPAPPEAAGQVPAPLPDPPPQTAEETAPVRVIMGDDGDVVILSRDPVAAEAAKQFVEQIVPGADDVQVIPLVYAQAALVKTQLDALLLHTLTTTSSALTTQQPLRIDSDSRTNRLLIQHASPRQMQLINEMIPLLDQPEQEDARLVRQQRVYRAQHKRATEIALVVKEVYRDLLSTNDKIFAGRDPRQPFGYNRAQAATTKSPEYQGLLSVGVDDVDNLLVLSAPAYLMEEVLQLVKVVDTNAGDKVEQIVPGDDDVKVISLVYAQAALVKTQLDALLHHTLPKNPSALDARRPLLIEADSRTNRLMIQHATPRQMQLIDELITQLDQPEKEDARLVRQQRVYRAEHKRATEIALVVKEVYRDLLSTNDKIFAGRDPKQPFGYNRAQAATTKSPEYQGLLSVGADDEDNLLVISAPAYLMEEVMQLVKQVDSSSGGKTVAVVPLKSRAAQATLKETLGRLLAKPTP